MEGSRKYEDAAVKGTARHHVWKSRTSDLTVVNLRDISELLGVLEPVAAPPATAATEAKATSPATMPTPSVPRPTTGKQESLNALLAKLQLGRPTPESPLSAPAKAPMRPATTPPHSQVQPQAYERPPTQPLTPSPHPPSQQPAASYAPATASVMAASVAGPSLSAPPMPVPPLPPPRIPEPAHNPSFPDPKESSSSVTTSRFEFITGTNIPGQGVLKKPEVISEGSSMALFHDPLWGGSATLDAFSAAPPVKRSPKPQPLSSLSELYGSTVSATVSAFASNTAGAAAAPSVSPAASPPVGGLAASSLPTAISHQPSMPLMSGLMPAPSPQLGGSYPMYSMPIQYMGQPQFPAGMMYNSAAFFPYGAAPMMMAQPQQMPQGYTMPTPTAAAAAAAAAIMRPGTNVKAVPFVPGNTTQR